ncbi:ferric reductase family protein [Sporobolomyces salmoneus]|uniref:ferric reductase family protein n=1 Tax=Sporobolomyces salmoneus TaxID=183962 RepID=UPI003177E499
MSVCFDSHGIPIPCGTGWTVYNSYKTDPRYQKYLTIAWTATIAVVFVFTVPSIAKFFFRGGFGRSFGRWQGLFGVYDDSMTKGYNSLHDDDVPPSSRPSVKPKHSTFRKPFLAILALSRSLTRSAFKLPFSSHHSSLSTGHFLFLLLIPLFIFVTLFPESQLAENPNRFGFLALACIPPLFVLSSKNGAISLLLGRSWIAVNFLHRWIGRAILLLVVCHFGLWSAQWARAGRLNEFLSSSKERRGIGAFAFLLLITISSLPRFRRFSYPLFFTLHYVSILGFLVFLNQHTIYARGWATWSVVGIYAVDIVGRIASMRIRWVEVEPLEGGMTKVMMKGVKGGWIGGQTIDLRLFFVPPTAPSQALVKGGVRKGVRNVYRSLKAAIRPFESHPFSVATASPTSGGGTILGKNEPEGERGIELYMKSCGKGTWTDDLYRFTRASSSPTSYESVSTSPTRTIPPKAPTRTHVLALFFGPYASTLSTYSTPELFEEKETVSLFAGGSGMSFVMGVLEDLVGRRLKKGKRGQVEVTWVVREQAHVSWFLPRLNSLLSSIPPSSPLSVSLQIHVASPSSVSSTSLPLPPHTALSFSRPHLPSLLNDQLSRTLSPCSHCYPVCKCGETNVEGVCANEEEECVGSCGGIGNGTELLFDTRGGGGAGSEGFVGGKSEKRGEDIEEENGKSKSCCCRPKSTVGGQEIEVEEKKKSGGCCSSSESKEARGCCSTRYPPSVTQNSVREAPTPLKVRNGGWSIVVCGPSRMTGELRNAVARIPIAKQVRVGGIDLHVEQYGI